jgi:hypothetical protein
VTAVMAAQMTDARGTTICTGDIVQVLYIDTDRGAHVWMHRGEVVGFGRTRVRLMFPSRGSVQTVGPECLRVVGSRRSFG